MSPRAKPAAPGAGLSRARVCQEALALVDAEGPEALSMRRLGARLGVEAMSLYRHVRDKADLIDALHAAVLGDLEPERESASTPTTDERVSTTTDKSISLTTTDERASTTTHGRASTTMARDADAGDDQWRGLLGGLCRALRTALLRHPKVVPLFMTAPMRAPEAWAKVGEARAALAAAGFHTDAAEQSIHVVGMFTIGHVLFEARAGIRKNDTFRLGLESLLDGIAAQPHPRTRGASHA
jgi:AcrR family transcriptional regulator